MPVSPGVCAAGSATPATGFARSGPQPGPACATRARPASWFSSPLRPPIGLATLRTAPRRARRRRRSSVSSQSLAHETSRPTGTPRPRDRSGRGGTPVVRGSLPGRSPIRRGPPRGTASVRPRCGGCGPGLERAGRLSDVLSAGRMHGCRRSPLVAVRQRSIRARRSRGHSASGSSGKRGIRGARPRA